LPAFGGRRGITYGQAFPKLFDSNQTSVRDNALGRQLDEAMRKQRNEASRRQSQVEQHRIDESMRRQNEAAIKRSRDAAIAANLRFHTQWNPGARTLSRPSTFGSTLKPWEPFGIAHHGTGSSASTPTGGRSAPGISRPPVSSTNFKPFAPHGTVTVPWAKISPPAGTGKPFFVEWHPPMAPIKGM